MSFLCSQRENKTLRLERESLFLFTDGGRHGIGCLHIPCRAHVASRPRLAEDQHGQHHLRAGVGESLQAEHRYESRQDF